MFFVGIDIAKNSHEAAVIDGSGKIVERLKVMQAAQVNGAEENAACKIKY